MTTEDDWDFNALPNDVLETMKLFGNLGPTVIPANREVKGYMDGSKYYLTSNELREAARNFIVVANWLDRRAGDSK